MVRDKVNTVTKELNKQFIEMDTAIEALTLGVLSGEHVFFIGPPGTAKSKLVRCFAGYFGGRVFSRLLTQYTTPDEVFGPVDIKAYKEQGVFKRITTSKLPNCEFAFLDEVFKANSAILNSLLKLLEERKYDNDGTEEDCSLVTCVGASNEFAEPGLEALYDRFLIRVLVEDVSPEGFLDMVKRPEPRPPAQPTIDMGELNASRAEIAGMTVEGDALEGLQLMRERLRELGYRFSPRRYKRLIKVMAAKSWLGGSSVVNSYSLSAAPLVLWDNLEQRKKIAVMYRECINPYLARAEGILASAIEAYNGMQDSTNYMEWAAMSNQIQHFVEELDTMGSSVKAVRDRMSDMKKTIIIRMMNWGSR